MVDDSVYGLQAGVFSNNMKNIIYDLLRKEVGYVSSVWYRSKLHRSCAYSIVGF